MQGRANNSASGNLRQARRALASGNRRNRARGWTLLELMIVISMIMILMAVAVPIYNQSIVQA